MIHWLIICLLCIPSTACSMELSSKRHKSYNVSSASFINPHLPFYSTYQKKHAVTQLFEQLIPQQKDKPIMGLAQFESAVDTCDIPRACAVLVAHNYHPKQPNLNDAIRYDDLPAIIYWLNYSFAQHPAEENFFPLHQAARCGNEFCIGLLLAQGIDVNGLDRRGLRPLDLAVHQGMKKAACVLLDYGAYENNLNGDNRTPLFYLIPRFSNERKVPIQWIRNLILMYLTHAQWDPLQPVESAAYVSATYEDGNALTRAARNTASDNRLRTTLLTCHRLCHTMPRDIRIKIASYLPEDIYCFRLFNTVFGQVEKNKVLIYDYVMRCPFAWFKQISNAKLLSSTAHEHREFVERITPVIGQYRLSRISELLTPQLGTPSPLIRDCISELEQKPELMLTVIRQSLSMRE